MLGWSQEELAEKAGVSSNSVAKLEAGQTDARLTTILAIKEALERGGIRFIAMTEGEGLLLLRRPER